MSKGLGLIGLLVVIGLGAYLYTNQMSKETSKGGAMETLDKAKEVKVALEEKGMVSSIKDAMGLGTAMQCTYAMEQDGKSFESVVKIEGEKFRSESVIAGVTTYALSDGKDQYMWTSSSKQGFKMNKACLDDLKKMFPATSDSKTSSLPKMEDAEAALDMAKNVQCNPIESVDLTVPKDITFTDQCAMMKDSMKAMEQMKDKMPAGINIPMQQ